MNVYGNYDYKKPSSKQNDYRTSTYRGHLKLDEIVPIQPVGTISDVCMKFQRNEGDPQPCQSEIQENYKWKPTDPDFIRNPTIKDIKCMKPYEERRLLMPPRPLPPNCSTYKGDYQLRDNPSPEKPPVPFMPAPVKYDVKLSINRARPGYAKYLDPSATTNNLSFQAYSTQDLVISVKDNITFWNWKKKKYNVFKVKEAQCDEHKSAQCQKRRREFRNGLKPVPHSGSTSEFQANYFQRPNPLNYDVTHIKNRLVSFARQPLKAECESMIYGSGKRTQKYV